MKEKTMPATTEARAPQPPDTREESRTLVPPVDIFESDDGLAVVADLPGVDKEAVEVRVENDVLTLKATPKSALAVEPAYREFQLMGYFRQFQLSEAVDQDKIKAEMKHGVLVIRLPKKEEKKPKQITVKVS